MTANEGIIPHYLLSPAYNPRRSRWQPPRSAVWRPFLLDQPVLPRWGLGHYFHLAGGDRATESWRRATFAGGVGRAGRGAPGSISIWSASTRLLVDQPISWLPLNHNCDAVLNNWSATPNLPCRSVLQYKLGDFFSQAIEQILKQNELSSA